MRAKRKPLPVAKRKAGVDQACLISMASPGKLVLRMQRQILSLLPRPARLLLRAAWACEWDPTSPLTAERSHLSIIVCICYGYPPYACMRITSPSTTQHNPTHPSPASVTVNTGKASVSTLQLPNTGITSAKRSLPIKIEHNTTQNHSKATFADILTRNRLCPMLNGTWKPEDRPDGQGDSSFGAVPAALTL